VPSAAAVTTTSAIAAAKISACTSAGRVPTTAIEASGMMMTSAGIVMRRRIAGRT
jgi:hypothetical protein